MNKNFYLQLILYCLLIYVTVLPGMAQEQFASRYNISYITMDEGLLHNNISDIYKDKQGFIWVATKGGGLSRFDGYDFIHFNTNSSPVKLSGNIITTLCEDNFGRLWIGTDEGADILCLTTLQLSHTPAITEHLKDILSNPVLDMINDSTGNIWLTTEACLYKICFKSNGDILSIAHLSGFTISSPSVAMSDIDEDGNIWFGHANKIYKVVTNTDNLLQLSEIPVVNTIGDVTIHCICKKENEVWIGTGLGIFRYNRHESILKYYRHEPDNPRSLSQSYITDIVVNYQKQLIVSTFQGINIYNPVTDDFERISKTANRTGCNLNSDFINCMLVDKEIIWLGSDVGGINKITPRRLFVHNYIHQKNNPQSLPENPVNAIYEDSSGTLWVGLVEGGLNKKPKNSEQFIHYDTHTPTSLSHNSVSSIVADGLNRLWVGTWGWGITILDQTLPENQVLQYITPHTHPGFPIGFIESLSYDSINNGIWIGTNPGIYFYDITADRLIKPIDPELNRKAYKALGAAITSKGELWMGSVENGIFIIDLHSRMGDRFACRHIKYKLDNPDSGIKERITSIYETSDSILWLGSNGHGLYRFAPYATGDTIFKCYTSKNGLINDCIRGIGEDDNGMVWISTNYGLSCLDPGKETFTNFTKEDGLINNQFYWNAHHKSREGNIYFGGTDGLIVIKGYMERPDASLQIVFTRLSIKNEEIFAGSKGLKTDISVATQLDIHERDNSFSLEFSALDYDTSTTAHYSYRLLGFEKEWIDIPANRRFVSYTNIPPGKYTFQVKYITNGQTNTGNSGISELTILIKPFFYKTRWFITLAVLLICGVVLYVYLRRIYFLQKQKELLHKLVEERTRELKEQNIEISNQKTQLIEMSKKVQELTLDKISFFTNITHEFRTPITLIAGPIERALKLSINPQVIEQLHFVERNSKYLLSLINQLMDFRKIESGKQEIIKINADFIGFIDPIIQPFEVFAADRTISIKKYYHINDPVFPFDHDAIRKIVTNLLSNAIKFTPNGGTISIYIAILASEDEGEKLYICIKDSGIGIAEEDLPKIFNRFYQSRRNTKFPVYGQSGTGIGLYLINRLVKMQRGEITAHNNKKAGSSFRILLPLERPEEETINIDSSIQQITVSDKLLPYPDNFRTGELTILIVEDNSDMRHYIRSILEEKYNVMEAENGQEAISLLMSYNVDFIISDLMMPVMDGMELSQQVKQNFTISHIPFLMLTAKTSEETRLESYRTGVDEYIQKPFSEELLLTRINNILENRKRCQQKFALHMQVDELHIDEESKDKKFMDKIMNLLQANYINSSYGVQEFISDMGVSKPVLNRKMQNLTGQSIGQFIRNYRLNIAYEIIKKNRTSRNMNIAEIAYEVGFNDPKYFTRCFTKHYNTTPSQLMEKPPW